MRSGGARGAKALAALLGGSALLLASWPARAGCCDLVKVDGEVPPGPVRACEPDASGNACAAVLFEGELSLGERAPVCSAHDTILYQEVDPATGAWAPPVTAVCEGGDVEL